MEIDTIYNMDCLEGMKMIPDGSVDCIICDLPYGTMNGIDDKHNWDEIIPTDKLFEQYERVLRRGGTAVLFSQEPYTSHLRTFKAKNISFSYPLIWKKDQSGNCLMAKKAPVSFFEDINVFRKANPIVRDMKSPLREYSRKLIAYTGLTAINLKEAIINLGLEAPNSYRDFFSPNAEWLFKLCLPHQYDNLIKYFGIDKMEGFLSYEECKRLWDESNIGKLGEVVFNLPENCKALSNVLEFSKDTDGFHPTQKPVALIRRLIQTYSNEGDTILDNCMGSGTTAIAAIREKRHFIGFEMNAEYYEKAMKRIKLERQQLTLF